MGLFLFLDTQSASAACTFDTQCFNNGPNPADVGENVAMQSKALNASGDCTSSWIHYWDWTNDGSWDYQSNANNVTSRTINHAWTTYPSGGSTTARCRLRNSANGGINGYDTVSVTISDDTAPTRSISYTNGWVTNLSLTVTTTESDPQSGVSTCQLQRRQATITNGSTGSFGGWSTVQNNCTNYTFTGVVNTAYQFQYRAQNGDGLWSSWYLSSSIAKMEDTPTQPGAMTTTWKGDHYVNTDFVAATTGSTDNGSGVAYYKLCRSANNASGCTAWVTTNNGLSTTHTVSGTHLPSDGTYRYYYWYAVDNAGLQSSPSSGVYVRMDTSAPVKNSLTITQYGTEGWKTNGTTSYNIIAVVTDNGVGMSEGATDIRSLINYQGSNNANKRGYFSWRNNTYTWSGAGTDQIACTGGGYASKHNTNYGYDHITLTGCTTSLSGKQRTVTWTVQPGATFGDFFQLNDISLWTRDAFFQLNGWTNYDLNFTSDGTPPVLDAVTLQNPDWVVNGSNTYSFTVKASDATTSIDRILTIINLQGTNNANKFGYFGWDEDAYIWGGSNGTDNVACAGGGYANKYNGTAGTPSGYGKEHTTLVGCEMYVNGNQRMIRFTVRPETTFGSFEKLNDISALSFDQVLNNSAPWGNTDFNFTSQSITAATPCSFTYNGVSTLQGGQLVEWLTTCGVDFANFLLGTGEVTSNSTLTAIQADDIDAIYSSFSLPNQLGLSDDALDPEGSLISQFKNQVENDLCSLTEHSYDVSQLSQDYSLDTPPLSLNACVSESSCATLGWTNAATGNPNVCGESDAAPLTGCSGEMTYSAAKAFCENAGARLCTIAEIADMDPAGTGCGYDNTRIWSSTSCGTNSYWTRSGSELLPNYQFLETWPPECTLASAATGVYVRCCADVY